MRPELKTELEKTIHDNHTIKLRIYSFLEETEKTVDFAVSSILTNYKQMEHKAALMTIIKELCKNAVEANMKKVFFDDIEANIDNDFHYKKGKERFLELNKKDLAEFARKARNENLFAELTLDYSPEKIIIQVLNNRSLWPIEEEEILENSKNASKYSNILSYYKEVKKNKNTPKNGITLITLLLKSENLDLNLFSVDKIQTGKENLTVIKIVFPISKDFYK